MNKTLCFRYRCVPKIASPEVRSKLGTKPFAQDDEDEDEDHDTHEDEDVDDGEDDGDDRAPSVLDSHVVPTAHEAMRASRGISAHLQDPGSGF